MEPAPDGGAHPLDLARDVAVVAIGRNEGERLVRCFDALPPRLTRIVYVDSASTDDSVAHARRRAIEVVELDMSTPFTAARARNAGFRRALERWPDVKFVQLLDGDCALDPGWLEFACAEMQAEPRLAMACGRRREVDPDASLYNRLCDVEWDTPVGDAESCGGDSFARVAAWAEVSGFDERVIAGEEPELCARLRGRGWRVRRLDREMTRHDAAMTRFAQWWRRAMRSGYGFAQVSAIHAQLFRRNLRSSLTWALALPAGALLAWPASRGWSLVVAPLAYAALWLRIVRTRRARGDRVRHAAEYASFCVLGKFPEALGALKYGIHRVRGRRGRIIEYK